MWDWFMNKNFTLKAKPSYFFLDGFFVALKCSAKNYQDKFTTA